MNDELAKMKKDLRLLKYYAVIMTSIFIIAGVFAFSNANVPHFKEVSAEPIQLLHLYAGRFMSIRPKKYKVS